MEQLQDQSGAGSDSARAAEQVLQSVTQDLQALHQGLIVQLTQEVTRLQAEKARLLTDIEKLQVYHRALQSRQMESLSQQQVAQQQLWAKQLAQILAHHLQAQIAQRLNQIAAVNQSSAAAPAPPTALAATALAASGHSENAHRLLASLDSTFSDTFKTLQRELDSYHSSLSQQLNRMHSLEQQGEAILEALINRLREQLQAESSRIPSSAAPSLRETGYPLSDVAQIASAIGSYPALPNPPVGNSQLLPPHPSYSDSVANGYPTASETSYSPTAGNGSPAAVGGTQPFRWARPTLQGSEPTSMGIPAAPLPLPPKPKKGVSNFQLGLGLVLISTIALSFHNVVVKIIGKESTILGGLLGDGLTLGGVINLSSLGNSMLLLWLRMLIVLPLMIPVARFLYPSVWKDIRKFLSASDRRPIFNVVGSGCFLFISQILIYVAISQIGPGPAVTIMFMYPIVTVPLAWFLFGDRPTTLRWVVMGVIGLGVVLTRLGPLKPMPGSGLIISICAGIGFALYLILMQLGFKKLHPIPVSLIQFFTIFVISSFILILPLPLTVHVDHPGGFILGGLVLGALTLVGYLANNFGVRYMGAARASIIASSGPAMTALLALLIIQDHLGGWQWIGILLVTGGVAALSLERLKTPAKPATK